LEFNYLKKNQLGLNHGLNQRGLNQTTLLGGVANLEAY
jgi:hypothetical protein